MKKIIFVLPLLAMMVVGCSNPTNTETPEQNKTVETTTQQTPEPAATPTVPQQPQTPVQPETPETPVTTTPTEPETPVVPETPSEPQVPEEPATPTQPEQPATPQQPETPVQPEQPETPAVQEDKSPYEYVLPNGVDYNDYTYVGDYVFSDMYDFANCVWFNGTANSEYGYFMVLEKIARVRYNGSGTPYALYDWDNDTYPLMEKGTSYKVYLKPEYIQARKDARQLLVFTSYGTTRDKNPDTNCFNIRANNYNYDTLTLRGSVNVSDFVAY